MLDPHTFEGKTALVTGGSSGIGLSIADCLVQLGADVAIIGRNQERLEAAVEKLSAPNRMVRGYSVDIRNNGEVLSALGRIEQELSPISLLVNNAAGNFRVDPLELSPNGWRSIVDIVLTGTWNVTQAVARAAIESNRPLSVVNIGTTAAATGSATTVHSASAKSGVLTMTKSLAAAWAPHGIRLNAVSPGLTQETGGINALYAAPEDLARHLEAIPLGRLAEKQEVANACAYLLSEFAGYITGTNLVIDGGRQLGTH